MSARSTSGSGGWLSKRALTVASVACVAGGVTLLAVALSSGSAEPDPLTSIEPAVAVESPVTIAPRYDGLDSPLPPGPEQATGGVDSEASADATAEAATGRAGDLDGDGELSADELAVLARDLPPTQSARLEDLAPLPKPAGLRSERVRLDRYPVRPVGLEPDGQMEVPDETEIGWYRYGATPGQPGATVLAAHVSWNNTVGPFFRLGEMEPGDQITVALDDGSERTYAVIERAMYEKDELPRDRLWRTTGPETLVLITCGGDFNPDIRRYRSNIVIYAVPVADDAPIVTPE